MKPQLVVMLIVFINLWHRNSVFWVLRCVWLKHVQNAKLYKVLTWKIATKDKPAGKSFSPSSTTTFSRVQLWLLFIVNPQAILRGSCIYVRNFPALVSCLATASTIGTQGLMPSQAGFSGPSIQQIPHLEDAC